MTTKLHSVILHSEEDVVAVRRQARAIAGLLGFDENDRTRIATAVSEIARNAYHYGSGGLAEFLVDAAEATYTVRISDCGPGIPDLKKILNGAYRSKTGMGLGLIGARRLMDDFRVESEPGKGTVVHLSKRLPERSSGLKPQRLAKISADIGKAVPHNVLDELREENRELLRLLDELRARQDELTRVNLELEDTNRGVVALYAELDERAERLRRADEMKSRFLSHMSHEFRTPLTSIMALSRLLMDESDGKLSGEQHKQAMFIRKSAENLLEMVNDLLDLARIEAGKSVVRPVHFQVSSLFGALRSVLRPLQVNGDIELVFEDPVGIPPLFTDEAKLAQILRNFISNALKFTERGEVRVSAHLGQGGESAIFAVSDTGIGIEPKHLELIFQEFQQIETPIQARFRGTGLGLPLSKGLAELLGGRVRVESTVGHGSVFTAEIPVVFAGADLATAPASGCDLLVVDDEEVSRYLIRQALGTPAGLAEAENGVSGLDAARRLNPRAVLLDIRMPGMSGLDVLKELKADPGTRDIPVVIMTSKALTKDEHDYLRSQAVAILSKEVLSNSDAGLRIRAALEEKSAGKPADTTAAAFGS